MNQSPNQIKWHERYALKVANIDQAHQRLFSIVSKVFSLNQDIEKQRHACQEGIKYFKSYTIRHFAEEEAYMRSINYEHYEMHKRLHDNMKNVTLPALEKELEEQNYSPLAVQHFLGLCIGWLDGHILVEDRAIIDNTYQKWILQPGENELEAFQKAVKETMEYLYRVNATPVSRHYGGEDFASGNTLCYRLVYSSAPNEYWQVYMLYEGQMVLNILTERLEKPIKRIDQTVSHALRVISEDFMECVSRHFPFTDDFILEKTDLMSFEQITKIFQKHYPPYSLLFSTGGGGYFALCVDVPKQPAEKNTDQTSANA